MHKLGDTIKGNEIGRRIKDWFVWTICPDCRKERWVRRGKTHLKPYTGVCQSCNGKRPRLKPSGSNHWKWKGGRKVDLGYIRILLPRGDFFYSMTHRGYVAEHRLIIAQHLNRCLLPWESVHHKNGVKTDNRIENLEMFPTSIKHNRITRWEAYIKQREDIAFKAGQQEVVEWIEKKARNIEDGRLAILTEDKERWVVQLGCGLIITIGRQEWQAFLKDKGVK